MRSQRNSRTTFTWVSLYTVWYNWLRIHKTLRVTPAMAAGLTPSLMSMADVVAMIDADEAKAIAKRRRGMVAIAN